MRRSFIPLLFLLIIPIIEITAFILVGNAIGLWPTLGLVVATAVLGVVLLRQQGFATLRRIQAETRAGRVPGRELVHGAMILLAGILLLTPGLVSDAIGLLLFVPPVREAAWRLLRSRIVIPAPGSHGRGGAGQGDVRPMRRPEVVDLSGSDYKRQGDPDSPWKGPVGGGEDGAKRTLH